MKLVQGSFLVLLTLFLAAALFSCGPAAGSSSSAAGSTGAIDPNAALAGIDVSHELPGSLGGDNAMKMKMKMKMKSPVWAGPSYSGPRFTVGDSNVFDPAALPDVQAQGWQDLVDGLTSEGNLTFVLNGLRSYASNHVIQLNAPMDISFPGPTGLTNTVTGKFICRRPSDNELQVYLNMLFIIPEGGTNDFYLYNYIDFTRGASGKFQITFNLKFVPLPGYSNANALLFADEKVYTTVNETTHDVADFYSKEGEFYYTRSYTRTDGSVLVFNQGYDTNAGHETVLQLAWGNDQYGGLVHRQHWASPEDLTVSTEYYGSNGSLVFYNYGDTNLSNYTVNMDYFTNGAINLHGLGYPAAPLEFYALSWYTNIGGQWSNAYIVTNYAGSPVTNITGSDTASQNFIFMAAGAWAQNDAIYDQLGNSIAGGKTVLHLYKAQSISPLQTLFGDNYYVYNRWALKYLALSNFYSAYQITRKVTSETNWTNIYTNSTGPVTNAQYAGDYFWWIDWAHDMVFDPTNDIELRNIYDVPVWIYDYNTGISFEQRGIVAAGTDPNPFRFTFTRQSLLDSVNSYLTSVYNAEVVPFDIKAYCSNVPAMPDTSLFPALP